MDLITGIAVAVKVAVSVAHKMAQVVQTGKEIRETLSGESLSPGDAKKFVERFAAAADKLSDANQLYAEAHSRMADSAAEAVGIFGVMASSINQGVAILSRMLDLAEKLHIRERHGIDTDELRKLLPKPPEDAPPTMP
jgi:hypothetical protein